MSELVHLDPRGLEPSVLSIFWQTSEIAQTLSPFPVRGSDCPSYDTPLLFPHCSCNTWCSEWTVFQEGDTI